MPKISATHISESIIILLYICVQNYKVQTARHDREKRECSDGDDDVRRRRPRDSCQQIIVITSSLYYIILHSRR